MLLELGSARLGLAIGVRELAIELLDLLVTVGQRGRVLLRLVLTTTLQLRQLAFELLANRRLLGGLCAKLLGFRIEGGRLSGVMLLLGLQRV